jgi:hypothetical protein
MRQLEQLRSLLDIMPVAVQAGIALFLTVFSLASIYGRFNTSAGKVLFSRIPPEEIQTNVGHIFQYTVIPCAVWIGFLILLALHHKVI